MASSLFQNVTGRLLAGALVALALMGLHVTGHIPRAEALTNCDVADLTYQTAEADFLTLINEYRAANGKAALTVSQHLNRAASWHAHSIATENYFSHTDSSGRSAGTRARDCGAQGGIGENLTAGTIRDTAQEAFDAWKASPGHNANMLNGDYKQIGIARYNDTGSDYQWYWVTVFSNTDDGTRLSAGDTGGGSGSGGGTGSGGSGEEEAEDDTTTEVVTGPKAVMTFPVAGSTVTGTSIEFLWQHGVGAQAYYLYVGNTVGGSQYLAANVGLVNTITVNGFPRNGSKIYVRLWTLTDSGWQFNDYEYTLPR